MYTKLYAPYLDGLLRQAQTEPIVVDAEARKVLMQIISSMEAVKICGGDERRMLWFNVERGSIEEFGDYREYIESGDVDSYEQFEEMWLYDYPEAVNWYAFVLCHFREDYYFYIGGTLTFHITDYDASKAYPADNSELIEWLRQQVEHYVAWLRDDEKVYNDFVTTNISYLKRTGRIVREEYWCIDPDDRQWTLRGLTPEDINTLALAIEASERGDVPSYDEMTTGKFFDCCKLGYVANDYFKGEDFSAAEMYKRYADGRHDGLLDLELDSPEAFAKWYATGMRGGHPWEICRGGNSTHISLYVHKKDDGWRLHLAGSSRGRVAETVRFALALHRNRVPFDLRDAREILTMVRGKDYIGIVPENVKPRYCHSLFPKEDKIIDFMNLEGENKNALIAVTYWYPLEPIELA